MECLARDSLFHIRRHRRRSRLPRMAKARSTLLSGNRPPPTTNSNLLLAALPVLDYARLLPTLEAIPLTLRHVLHRPTEPIKHVYFPGGGFCSMVTVLK